MSVFLPGPSFIRSTEMVKLDANMLGLKIISAFRSLWGWGEKKEQGFRDYGADTLLGYAGVSQAGGNGASEAPADLGSREKPLTWTVGSRRGGKTNPVPLCEISLNRNVIVSSTEVAVVWNQVRYWDGISDRCPEEHFDTSLRRKKTVAIQAWRD